MYNLKQSLPDPRDYIYQPTRTPLRPTVDLREWDSLVESQEDLGSCTSNALTNAYELMIKQQNTAEFVELSRLFVYYNTRLFEGTVGQDSGAFLIDGLKALKVYGVCKELLWPYNVEKFNTQPTQVCYEDGSTRKIKNYQKLAGLDDILDALNRNWPVVIGMAVFESFNFLNVEFPIVKMPGTYEESIGGHAMDLVGYDLQRKQCLAKNSFGTDWGMQGYCWIPFEYIDAYVFDRWVFELLMKPTILV